MNHRLQITQSWQDLVKHSIRDIGTLLSHLGLPEQPHFSEFPILVPEPYLSRIEKKNVTDPLLLQVLSSDLETIQIPGYSNQPLDENKFSPVSGLIQKYNGRVLIISSSICAINCRYCFRRHYPYEKSQLKEHQWDEILNRINNDHSIKEVILSGGDPLMLTDKILSRIVSKIEALEHVKTLRLHTRMPMVIPQRINHQLLGWVKSTRLQIVLVNHINHEREIDSAVHEAMKQLQQAGVTLLNQSVLLKGINDTESSLIKLSEKLFSVGILPYYVHMLDPVSGAAHFNVKQKNAVALIEKIKNQLPGYLVPKLVREVPGEWAKKALY